MVEAVEVLGVQVSVVEESTGVTMYDGAAGRLAVRVDVTDEIVLVRVFAVVDGGERYLGEAYPETLEDADVEARRALGDCMRLALPEAA